ncbi:MAG: tetratricopeptide repeat protein [Calditrichaeota bacterium]|nr:MAG: tetratricopeptide repeat protein [Calditrichota bacterium]
MSSYLKGVYSLLLLLVLYVVVPLGNLYPQSQRVIGIIPFSNEGNARYQWLTRGIEYLFYEKLGGIQTVTVYERETLQRILNKLQVKNSQQLSPRKAFSIGKASGIEVLLSGSYKVERNKLQIDFRLVSTYTGSPIYTQKFFMPLDQLFQISEKMIEKSFAVMTIPLSKNDLLHIRDVPTTSIDAFEAFCKAYVEVDKESPMEVIAGYFQKAIQKDPQFRDARYNLGVIYYNFRFYEKAFQEFEKVIQQDPQYFKPYFGKGVIYYLKRDYSASLKELKTAIDLNPLYDRSYYYLGIVYSRMDSLKKSIQAFQRAIDINPNYAPTYYHLGLSEMKRGWYKQAIQSLKKATQLDNQFYQANNALGEAYYALNLFEEAIIEFNKAISLKPNFATAYFNLGNAIYKKGALEEIVDAFWALIEVQYVPPPGTNGTHTTAISDLKRLRDKSRIGDPNEVLRRMVKAYRTALKYDNRFYEASYNLALAYEHLNKPDSAIYYYKMAISLKDNLAQAHMRLGKIYESRKEYDLALQEFRKVVEIEPEYFSSNPKLGEPYRYINIVESVLNEYLKKLEQSPRDPKILATIARIYLSLGRLGQAEQYYTQVVELQPDDYLARKKLREIRRRMKKM